jgi:adenylate kinase
MSSLTKIVKSSFVIENIVLLGAPGSGKSTFAKIFPFHDVVSAGAMIRKMAKENYPLSNIIRKQLKQQNEVDEEIATNLVLERLHKLRLQNKAWVLDGYPRNINQAILIRDFLKNVKIFHLDIDEQAAYQRILNRSICPICNENYNFLSKKPVVSNYCNHCFCELEKRDDDKMLDIIRNRWKLFRLQNLYEVKDFFKKNQMPVVTIDATSFLLF